MTVLLKISFFPKTNSYDAEADCGDGTKFRSVGSSTAREAAVKVIEYLEMRTVEKSGVYLAQVSLVDAT